MENVFTGPELIFDIVATTELESMPPLRNAPSGTSAISRSFTDSSSRSRRRSMKNCSVFP